MCLHRPLLRGDELPNADTCECSVAKTFMNTVFQIGGQLEDLLERSDRVAQMLECSRLPEDH
jgi:hypothetical protein